MASRHRPERPGPYTAAVSVPQQPNEQPADSAPAGGLPPLAVLGAGNMAGAIVAGLRTSTHRPAEPIRVTTRSIAAAERFADAADVRALAVEADPGANREAVAGAGVVLLGVKPAGIAALLDEIAPVLEPGAIVVSVAAGVSTEAIERRLPASARVVRAMPNTPAALGLGVTGVAPGSRADREALDVAGTIFRAVGEVIEVDESLIAGVGALSGSGPAYVYLFVEELIRAARGLGFTAEQARTLAVGTLRGAGELLAARPDEEPSQLRREVTSPRGTTERSIAVFEAGGLGELVERAVLANIERAGELAAENA